MNPVITLIELKRLAESYNIKGFSKIKKNNFDEFQDLVVKEFRKRGGDESLELTEWKPKTLIEIKEKMKELDMVGVSNLRLSNKQYYIDQIKLRSAMLKHFPLSSYSVEKMKKRSSVKATKKSVKPEQNKEDEESSDEEEIKDGKEEKTNAECPVCYDSCNDCATLKCGHDLCRECLNKLQSRVCPLCRTPIEANRFSAPQPIRQISLSEEIRIILQYNPELVSDILANLRFGMVALQNN